MLKDPPSTPQLPRSRGKGFYVPLAAAGRAAYCTTKEFDSEGIERGRERERIQVRLGRTLHNDWNDICSFQTALEALLLKLDSRREYLQSLQAYRLVTGE